MIPRNRAYAEKRLPATYQDFIEFDKNSRYKLSNKRLKKLEKLVQKQAMKLLLES